MYAVQNDTELKFNRVLYIQVIFVWMGWGLNQLNSTGHVTLMANMTKKQRKARAYKYPLSLI